MDKFWLILKIVALLNVLAIVFCIALYITGNKRQRKSKYADCIECDGKYPKPLMVNITNNVYICTRCIIEGRHNQTGKNLLEYLLKEVVRKNKEGAHFGFD